MPKLYSDIKASYLKQGRSYDKAQEIAARTFYRLTGKTVQQAAKGEHKGKGGKR